jgi:hypothetical protein
MREISAIIPFVSNLRHEEITYIIDEASFKKIVTQFVKQTQLKEIIVTLLIVICKGFLEYSAVIEKSLYDALDIIV